MPSPVANPRSSDGSLHHRQGVVEGVVPGSQSDAQGQLVEVTGEVGGAVSVQVQGVTHLQVYHLQEVVRRRGHRILTMVRDPWSSVWQEPQ